MIVRKRRSSARASAAEAPVIDHRAADLRDIPAGTETAVNSLCATSRMDRYAGEEEGRAAHFR